VALCDHYTVGCFDWVQRGVVGDAMSDHNGPVFTAEELAFGADTCPADPCPQCAKLRFAANVVEAAQAVVDMKVSIFFYHPHCDDSNPCWLECVAAVDGEMHKRMDSLARVLGSKQ
jgi:hypothetical protein